MTESQMRHSTSSMNFTPSIPEQRNGSGPSKVKGANIKPRVLKIIQEADGSAVYVDDLARELDTSISSIQTAIRRLQEHIPHIRTIARGQVWHWKPETEAEAEAESKQPEKIGVSRKKPKPEKLTFVEIGKTHNGALVIESNQGFLYRAEPLA